MKEIGARMAAMQLAIQLPRDEKEARRIYELLGQLLNEWVLKGSDQPPPLSDFSEIHNVTKLGDRRDKSSL